MIKIIVLILGAAERTVALETVMGIMDDFLTMFQSNFVHLEVNISPH
jgi:hypothetical protein